MAPGASVRVRQGSLPKARNSAACCRLRARERRRCDSSAIPPSFASDYRETSDREHSHGIQARDKSSVEPRGTDMASFSYVRFRTIDEKAALLYLLREMDPRRTRPLAARRDLSSPSPRASGWA